MPKKKKNLEERLMDAVKLLVKIRDNYTCQKCHTYQSGFYCQASHVIPVSGGNQFKFDPLNIKVLCFDCHRWWGEHPADARKWFKETFPERHEYLYGQSRKNVKHTIEDLEKMLSEAREIIKSHA
jgi:5-methylcytosine-specific restriction endonuclease McrA